MGIEYTLRFTGMNRAAVEEALRGIDGASLRTEPSIAFEFRRNAGKIEDMPDATAQFESEGLYFCDHGGYGREYLGQVIAKLVGAFGVVTVEQL